MSSAGETLRCAALVIGGGIAGASAAYALTGRVGDKDGPVVVLERESAAGYHSSGRSVTLYLESYGNAVIRTLIKASRPFLSGPPAGFAAHALLAPRGALMIARTDQSASLDAELAFARSTGVEAREVDKAEALSRHPALDPDYLARAMFEPDSMDIDIHALHHGFLRGLAAAGGRLVTDAEVERLERRRGLWRVDTRAGSFAAPVVLNAAGAWADAVAELAGVAPVGLVPKRRTVICFDPGPQDDVGAWPMVIDVDEEFYFKPDAGRILASPADETPVPPSDVQPEELDVALAVDRVERATRLRVRRLESKWAGLRTFAADETPVVGMDPRADGFFWLAGQGGYGIMTSPALSRVAAALALGDDVPADIAVDPAALSPARLAERSRTAGR